MSKGLLPILLAVTVLLALARDKPTQNDNSWMNPAPNLNKGSKQTHPKTQRPKSRGGVDGVTIKEGVPIPLAYYDVGDWNHTKAFRFRKAILNHIDNIERKENRIINIEVKGFADGLENKGIKKVSKNRMHPDCAKDALFDGGISDPELAWLRACQVQEMLRDTLKGKSYFLSIRLGMNDHYDEETGKGDTTGRLRKVEVTITYLERK
jgi:hypothetical protein